MEYTENRLLQEIYSVEVVQKIFLTCSPAALV
jgi:hypothetical protein